MRLWGWWFFQGAYATLFLADTRTAVGISEKSSLPLGATPLHFVLELYLAYLQIKVLWPIFFARAPRGAQLNKGANPPEMPRTALTRKKLVRRFTLMIWKRRCPPRRPLRPPSRVRPPPAWPQPHDSSPHHFLFPNPHIRLLLLVIIIFSRPGAARDNSLWSGFRIEFLIPFLSFLGCWSHTEPSRPEIFFFVRYFNIYFNSSVAFHPSFQ